MIDTTNVTGILLGGNWEEIRIGSLEWVEDDHLGRCFRCVLEAYGQTPREVTGPVTSLAAVRFASKA